MWTEIFRIPGLGIPINTYGASIMVGFLAATYIAIHRMNKLPWTLDLDKPSNRRLVAEDLARRGKVPPEKIPDTDPIDLGALGVSQVAVEESVEAVKKRKNSDFFLDLAILSMVFGLAGAKVIYVMQYSDQIKDSLHIFDITDGKLHPLGALAGLLPVAGFFWITRRRKIAIRNVPRTFVLMAIFTLLVALAGTRAMYIYKNTDEFRLGSLRAWQSGFVLYGGVILGFAAGVGYTWLRKRPFLLTADIAAPNILLGIGFGRIGCFFNGCCFGKAEPGFPLAVSYPPFSMPYQHQIEHKLIEKDAPGSLPVHPTQLYETAAMVILFFVLSHLWKKNPKPGFVLALSGMSYGAWRFFIEFLRDDPRPKVVGWVSFSQAVSLGLVAFCGALLAYFSKRKSQAPVLRA